MVDTFVDHPELHGIIRGTVEENDVGVTFAQCLLNNNEVNDDIVVILKIDSYYHTQRMNNPPKSVDYVVIVECKDGLGYDVYVIELRNVADTTGVKPREIRKKFETIFSDFFVRFAADFSRIFDRLNSMKLYLVTDPFNLRNREFNDDQLRERFRGTVLEAFGFLTPFEFRDRAYLIEVKIPDPVIACC